MQSLVLGASGVVGSRIVNRLVELGETPIAVSRSSHQNGNGVIWIQKDLMKLSAHDLAPISTIYCTAHSTMLANALPRLVSPGLTRVVLFTSTSLLTKLNSEIAAERDGLRKLAEGETETIAICEKLGIAWTVLRPTIIYDEGRDANISRLAAVIRRFGFMVLAGDGKGLRQPVHAADLAIGAINAAKSAAALNKTYTLAGGDVISYREMTGRIFDSLQKPRRMISIPLPLWSVALTLAQRLVPGANVAMGKRMSKDMMFDNTPAVADFTWSPRGFRPNFDAK